jgi:hypothetical protein
MYAAYEACTIMYVMEQYNTISAVKYRIARELMLPPLLMALVLSFGTIAALAVVMGHCFCSVPGMITLFNALYSHKYRRRFASANVNQRTEEQRA